MGILRCCIRSWKQNWQESKGNEFLIEFPTSVISKLTSCDRQQVNVYLRIDRLLCLCLDRHINLSSINIYIYYKKRSKCVTSFFNLHLNYK